MMEFLEFFGLGCLVLFLLLDLRRGARQQEAPRYWRLQGLAVTVVTVGLSLAVATGWAQLLGGMHLLDLSGLHPLAGAGVGILGYELLHYGYHRSAHRSNLLWRAAHQMHHSAERLDTFGANYLHPLDTVMFTTWASLVFFPILGLSPLAGGLGAAWIGFHTAFQHANIKTPHWLGYLVQRPESHVIHHGRGVHRHNYANLPLIDMLFGTFRNPREEELAGMECGFYLGASRRVPEMLLGQDVSRPAAIQDSGPLQTPG